MHIREAKYLVAARRGGGGGGVKEPATKKNIIFVWTFFYIGSCNNWEGENNSSIFISEKKQVATKLEEGGGKALVTRPLRK